MIAMVVRPTSNLVVEPHLGEGDGSVRANTGPAKAQDELDEKRKDQQHNQKRTGQYPNPAKISDYVSIVWIKFNGRCPAGAGWKHFRAG
jgi:hypothetical protein